MVKGSVLSITPNLSNLFFFLSNFASVDLSNIDKMQIFPLVKFMHAND